MRLVVTGARGQLGGEVVDAAERAGHDVVGLDRAMCDITAPGAAATAIAQHRPDGVINCAAWTRVDDAEREADAAHRDNVLGPRLLGAACQEAGILLCHLSTDFVFDGESRRPMDESTTPRPLSVYGATKLAGEEEVRRLCPRHQIVRTSWLFGRTGPNFVLTVLRLAETRRRLRVVADQVGSPTWTGHLAPALVRLLEMGRPGTYHLSGGGETTWYHLAEQVVSGAGLVGVEVEAISTVEYPTAARRPPYSVLDNRAWRLLGERPLPAWEDGLREYLDQFADSGAGD